ncbi:unnamed protein product [Musa textilis]
MKSYLLMNFLWIFMSCLMNVELLVRSLICLRKSILYYKVSSIVFKTLLYPHALSVKT